MMHERTLTAAAVGRVRREISIQRLLEWAFADECAQIDFEDPGTMAQGYGCVGNAYRMAQRGALGCRIDGGGRSWPDHDADLVASAVAVLPEGCGGRGMAVAIAEYARARSVPDAMVDAVSRCRPIGWTQNQHGRTAMTRVIGSGIDLSGRKPRRYDIRECQVAIEPTAQQIGQARRNYLQWWSALLEIKTSFQIQNDMSRWFVTNAMPVAQPWKKILAE